MKSVKSLTKIILVALVAFAMFFVGMTFALPQKTTGVDAVDAKTAMKLTLNGCEINFYPVFADASVPAGVNFYKKVADNNYSEITNPTMDNISGQVGTQTLYYTSSGGSIICFAIVELSWDNIFALSSSPPAVAENLRTGAGTIGEYLDDGVYTPYYVSSYDNWDCPNGDESGDPTINGISMYKIYMDYRSTIGFGACCFWSSKASSYDKAYYFDADYREWSEGRRNEDHGVYAILLYDFGETASEYSVTYDANDATSGSVPTDENTYAKDAEVTVLGNTGSLAKTDYTFAGWNTQADGKGTDYAANSTFSMGSDDVTLYAKWTPNSPVPSTGIYMDSTGMIVAGGIMLISIVAIVMLCRKKRKFNTK